MNQPLKYLLYLIVLFSPVCLSLPSDTKQKMIITADYADHDRKTGLSHFHGHVKVVQGTTHLTAEFLTLYSDKNNKITKGVATGKLAHYWTQPKPNSKLLHAYAKTITYNLATAKVTLIGNARVQQEHNEFKGPKIYYDVNTQHIISPQSKTGRTTIVLFPKEVKQYRQSPHVENSHG